MTIQERLEEYAVKDSKEFYEHQSVGIMEWNDDQKFIGRIAFKCGVRSGADFMLSLILEALRDHGNYTPGTHPTLLTFKDAANWIESKVKDGTQA